MIAGTLVALALALAAAIWAAAPLLSRRAGESEVRSATLGRARELHSRREQLVASLKDLEDDRATDKLDEDDYRSLRSRLEGDAIEVMRELDATEAEHARDIDAERRSHEPLPYPGGRGPGPAR